MIKRRSVLKLMAAPALMTVARPGFAQTKEKVTYAYLLDPAYDAVTWAMSNGKVTSDLIEVEARGLAIPQLIQATSAKQYDVIMTAVIAIPPAAARGLGQERFADQKSEGAPGQDARLLCAAIDRLHAGALRAYQKVRTQCRARR